jgi:hypothetical protein
MFVNRDVTPLTHLHTCILHAAALSSISFNFISTAVLETHPRNWRGQSRYAATNGLLALRTYLDTDTYLVAEHMKRGTVLVIHKFDASSQSVRQPNSRAAPCRKADRSFQNLWYAIVRGE